MVSGLYRSRQFALSISVYIIFLCMKPECGVNVFALMSNSPVDFLTLLHSFNWKIALEFIVA